ncbi:MAG: hypothetical protein EOP51_06260 [Sphingobacteriales bacterium]|nr:MAG: hypothetical protein EOP51_06260 [Sphingobacteriales bacterium]
MRTTYLLLTAALTGCNAATQQPCFADKGPTTIQVNQQATTLKDRFGLPEGFQRIATNGFGEYLRSLPLKKYGSYVSYYNGEVKTKPNVYAAVVNMDIGTKDLQQCADAVMRLRGEYLFHSNQADKIHFNFTSGFVAAYSKWREGYLISIIGNNVQWKLAAQPDASYLGFRNFMDVVFSYAGTLSLSRELRSVSISDMQIGDVLIRGGSPGHAVIVVDMAEDKQGHKMYMLAQSYMPAQDIQILMNPNNKDLSPWYELNAAQNEIVTPEWDFTINDLKRFKD